MPVLVDATVLSNLAAVGRFDLLDILNDTVHVASAVYEEIQQGLDEGYEFLAEVDQALDSGCLGLVTLESEREWRLYRAMPAKLQRGEAMSLAIAHSRRWRFLTDDQAARIYAKRSNVSYSGTLGILCTAVRRDRLTLSEANTLLAEMIARSRYRSPIDDLNALL